jgi:hypothetical protein
MNQTSYLALKVAGEEGLLKKYRLTSRPIAHVQ